MILDEFAEKTKYISLANLAGSMVILLSGGKISADKNQVIQHAIEYLESAKRGYRIPAYSIVERTNTLEFTGDLSSWNDIMKIDPEYKTSKSPISDLDMLVAVTRASGNPEAKIPEQLNQKAIDFYKLMGDYFLGKVDPIPAL